MKSTILIVLSLSFGLTAIAQIPKLISYQGFLTDNGQAVADDSYNIVVKIFDGQVAGNELWSESLMVSTVNGLFSTVLGVNTPLDLPFDQAYFLSTEFSGTALLPRTAMTASPYAFNAIQAGNPYALDNADGSAAEVVYVDENSRVGIGTQVPLTKVHLKTAAGTKNELFIEPGNWSPGGDEAQISLGDFNHRITSAFGEGTTFYDVDQFVFEAANATFNRNLGIRQPPRWLFDAQGNETDFIVYGDFSPVDGENIVAGFTAKTSPGVLVRFGSEQTTDFVDLGTDKDGSFVIEQNDVDAFVITTDGNVGIGKTFNIEPAAKLTVGNQNTNLKFYPEQRGFSADPNAFNLDMDGTKDLTLTDNFIVGNKVVISTTLQTPGNEALFVNGDILASGSITQNSDRRFKQDFKPIRNALSSLQQLNGLYYHWRVSEFPNKEFTENQQIGFIAQDIEKLFPEMVHTDQAGYKSVNYGKLTPVLVEAIKEQQAQIDQLKAEKAAFKAEMDALRSSVLARLDALERQATKSEANTPAVSTEKK